MRGTRTEAGAQLQTPIEGLAAENLGVGGAFEFRQTVKALDRRPFRQLIEIAIESSDEAVCTRRYVHDDLSLAHVDSLGLFELDALLRYESALLSGVRDHLSGVRFRLLGEFVQIVGIEPELLEDLIDAQVPLLRLFLVLGHDTPMLPP
jgi:hypothetical protein